MTQAEADNLLAYWNTQTEGVNKQSQQYQDAEEEVLRILSNLAYALSVACTLINAQLQILGIYPQEDCEGAEEEDD